MNTIQRLQEWYKRQCNGVWEHSSGIHIESCDNPGWWVKIELTGTHLETRPFAELSEGIDAQRFPFGPQWLSCRIEGRTWHGAGDETKLERILEEFLAWADDPSAPDDRPK
jgi:Immunity protein 53